MKLENGKVVIVNEGKRKKFKSSIEQVTFSSEFSLKKGQKVLFITERCVFQLVKEGLKLIETAPGIDIEKDILPYLEFTPIVEEVKEMDSRIFKEGLMGLKDMIGKAGN